MMYEECSLKQAYKSSCAFIQPLKNPICSATI